MSYCRPLPGDVWRTTVPFEGASAITNHSIAMNAITASINTAVQQRLLPKRAAEFVELSLISALTIQSGRNVAIAQIDTPPIDNAIWGKYLEGTALPDELTLLRRDLGARAFGMGVEIARETHVGRWDTEDTCDAPVRRSQVNNKALDTYLIERTPYYKVKNGYVDGRIAERKRPIATHFGDPYQGQELLWTARRDMYYVDFPLLEEVLSTSPKLPTTRIAYQQAEQIRDVLGSVPVDDSARSPEAMQAIEPVIDLPIDFRPRYIRPLITTLYVKDADHDAAA